MTLGQWLGFATWVGQLGLAILAVVRSRVSPLAWPLALLCFAMFGWSFAEWANATTGPGAWGIVDVTLSSLGAPLVLNFILAFVGARRRLRWLLVLVSAPFVLLALACASAFVSAWGADFARSMLRGRIQAALIVVLVVIGATLLVRHARKQSSADEKVRSALVVAALVIGGILGTADVLGVHLPIPSVLVSTALLALVVLRFRLIESSPARLSTLYSSAVAGGAVIAYFTAFHALAARQATLALAWIAISVLLVPTIAHAVAVAGAANAERARLAVLGRFSAQMAHDLKNPIAALKGAAQLLQEERAQGRSIDDRREYLDLLVQEADRLARLVDRYQRLGKLELAREPTRVDELLRRMATLRRSTPMPAPGVELALELPGDLPACAIDADLVTTALENLLANAFEALDGAGRVTLRAALADDDIASLVLEVEDTGSGMDARTLERALDELFTTKARGSGLGLPFAKRVAESHGGRIELESEQGKGTRVRLVLPVSGG